MVVRARWDPALHPRGPIGRFIPVGGRAEHRPSYNLSKNQQTRVEDQRWIGEDGTLNPWRPIGEHYLNHTVTRDRDLTPPERYSVKRYVNGGKRINEYLRTGRKPEYPGLDVDIEGLDSAIEASRLQIDTDLYRGYRVSVLEPNLLADVEVGDQVRDRGFTSTALDPGNSRMFGADMVRIEVPGGTHALVTGHTVQHHMGTASEVILGRGAVFEITGIERLPGGDDPIVGPYEGHRLIHARMVGYLDD